MPIGAPPPPPAPVAGVFDTLVGAGPGTGTPGPNLDQDFVGEIVDALLEFSAIGATDGRFNQIIALTENEPQQFSILSTNSLPATRLQLSNLGPSPIFIGLGSTPVITATEITADYVVVPGGSLDEHIAPTLVVTLLAVPFGDLSGATAVGSIGLYCGPSSVGAHLQDFAPAVPPLPPLPALGPLLAGNTLITVSGVKKQSPNVPLTQGVVFEALTSNTMNIGVGTSASQPYPLVPGQPGPSLPLTNVDELWIVGVHVGDGIGWLGV